MQTFIFDVMDGPSLEFSENRSFASLEAARRHARRLAASVPALSDDVEGWLVRLCDDDNFVLDAFDVEECAAQATGTPSRAMAESTARLSRAEIALA